MFFRQLMECGEITLTTRRSAAKAQWYLRGATVGNHQRAASARHSAAISEQFAALRRRAGSRRFGAKRLALCTGVALSPLMPGLGTANAQSASDAQVKALQAQIEQLQRSSQTQINELQRQVKNPSGGPAKSHVHAKGARDQ